MIYALCIWIGGIVGHAAIQFFNPDQRALYASLRFREFLPIAAAWICWPILLVLGFPLQPWIVKAAATYGLKRHRVKCSVCERACDYFVFRERFATQPITWFINRDHELVCSLRCAEHSMVCEGRREIH